MEVQEQPIKKSSLEIQALKDAKKDWKKSLRNEWDYKNKRNELLHLLISCRTPHWGGLKIQMINYW